MKTRDLEKLISLVKNSETSTSQIYHGVLEISISQYTYRDVQFSIDQMEISRTLIENILQKMEVCVQMVMEKHALEGQKDYTNVDENTDEELGGGSGGDDMEEENGGSSEDFLSD
ncbi:hypothetical protein AgCh_027809 [Apium graveolens]